MTGDRARKTATGMTVAAAVLAAAGGYLVSLAFRFVRLFGLW